MIKRLLNVFVLFSLCLPVHTRAEDFKVEEFFLDNGLQVIVIENHKAPIVKQMLFYKIGAADEVSGKGGTAHLLEHLMFRGTSKVKGQKFNRILEENGTDSNAYTSHDLTAYHQFMDISRLELAMFLETDRMNGLKIDDKDFETERDIVYQERKQRIDNNPSAKFFEKVRKVLWQSHPYGHPVTGQYDEIIRLTKKDVEDFYSKFYVPNNAVLVLSGDIDSKIARDLAEKYYGKLKKSNIEIKKFENLPEYYKARIEMKLPQVKLGRFVKMFVAPSFNYKPEKVYALDILSEYLSGDENSPLYQKLILKDKQALEINTYYDAISRSYGSFVINIIPTRNNNHDFDRILNRAWNYALKELTEERLIKIKQKMLADIIYLKDNPASLAQLVGQIVAVGGNFDDLSKYVEEISKVSLDEIKQVAQDLWDNAPQVTGLLYPEEAK